MMTDSFAIYTHKKLTLCPKLFIDTTARYMYRLRRIHQDGSTLVITILVLVILSILGTAALSLTNTELLIARNMRLNAKAFYNAEAGISVTIEQIRDSIFDEKELPYELTTGVYKLTVNGTDSHLHNSNSTIEIYKVENSEELLISNCTVQKNNNIYNIISTGYEKSSVELVRVKIEDISSEIGDVPGALSVFNPASNLNLSENMYIEGSESDNIPALYLDDTENSTLSNKDGNAQLRSDYNTTNSASTNSDQTNEDWTSWAQRFEDVVIEENKYEDGSQISSLEFGTVSNPEVCLVDGCNISGGTAYGILIIKGSVKISGNFYFRGIVIHYLEEGEEGLQLEFDIDTTGTPAINGAYITAGASSAININGNPDIIYNANDIHNAIYAAKKAVLIKKIWKNN
jgi:hypothetical protein